MTDIGTTGKGLPMRQDDFDHLLLAATVYAIGRGTYATDGVLDVLERNLGRLSAEAAAQLRSFILSYDDRMASGPRWRAVAERLIGFRHVDDPVLYANAVDRRIVFFCAFRCDIRSDDPIMPKLWERWASEYREVVFGRDGWNLMSARDLAWAGLIPLDEPLDGIQDLYGRIDPPDDRWVPLFRMLRDGLPDTGEES